MKIALPLHQQRFSSHFGGADAFALYAVDEATGEVKPPQIVQPPEHGRGVFPMWLRRQGATVVLASGMGPRASDIFTQHGITVVLGVEGDDPDTVVKDYLAGTLETSGEPCNEHSLHACGHHEGGAGGCGGHHHQETS